jgi:acyl phosphate:glycerol-3-phosphate acyltransferase
MTSPELGIVLGLVPVAYFVGTFPSAQIVARRRGVDITAEGSGNPGASNVRRVLGRKAGIVVFALDALKGFLPALVGLAIGGPAAGLALGAAALVGHIFPVTRRFRGGKGVANAAGMGLAVYPLVAVVLTALWLLIAKLTGRAVIGSLVIVVGMPVGLVLSGRPVGEIIAVAAIAALMALRHAGNIKRLVRGTEHGLGDVSRTSG